MLTRAGGVETAQLPCQVAGGGLIPTSALHVRQIDWHIGRSYIRQWHYLHHAPPVGFLAFGVFASNALLSPLVGVVLVSDHSSSETDGKTDWEIRRMHLQDCTARNAESRVLGVIIRWIRQYHPTVERLWAYADPSAGHEGIIYKAAGFQYHGLTSGPGGDGNPKTLRPGHHLRSPARKHRYILAL